MNDKRKRFTWDKKDTLITVLSGALIIVLIMGYVFQTSIRIQGRDAMREAKNAELSLSVYGKQCYGSGIRLANGSITEGARSWVATHAGASGQFSDILWNSDYSVRAFTYQKDNCKVTYKDSGYWAVDYEYRLFEWRKEQ